MPLSEFRTVPIEDFDMGRVVSRTFETIGRNAPAFLALAILAVIPQLVLAAVLGVGTGMRPNQIDPSKIFHMYGLMMVVGLASMIFSAILQAALVHGTISDLNGNKASFGDCLGTGIRTCLPVIGLTIVFSVAIFFGFILLIVPGVMLSIAWAVVVPVLVVEKTGVFATFGRSAELTKGHRWKIFGLYLAIAVLSMVLGFAILPLSSAMTTANEGLLAMAPVMALQGVVKVVVATISAAGVAAVYYELRAAKEGIGPEQLASVFD